jgi:hypothetical protein
MIVFFRKAEERGKGRRKKLEKFSKRSASSSATLSCSLLPPRSDVGENIYGLVRL